MGAGKESYDVMLHYGYAIIVYRDSPMGMVFRCLSGVSRYSIPTWIGCAAADFRIHVSICR